MKTTIQTAFAAAVFMAALSVMPSQAAPLAQTQLVDTFDTPVYVTGAPGASSSTLLFVVEQQGTIQVLDNEVTESTPFLDMTSVVNFDGERGLLSIAFPPDYETSKLFYVCFTNDDGDVEVAEFTRTSAKVADANSLRTVLVVSHREASNHNGGQLQFGPDGFLYISIGDGGEVFPRGKYSRDLTSLLGKILRVDPKQQGMNAYSIPPDNPFAGTANRGEIFSYGLRNPWRFSFNGNNIAIGDVGQNKEEEINFLPVATAKGANFGWPEFEGKKKFDKKQPGPDKPLKPMYVYDHKKGACAVIGGYIVSDAALPALSSQYLLGDLCTGRITSFRPDPKGKKAMMVRDTGIVAGGLSSFGVGPGNKIYITQTGGELSRIEEAH